MKRILIFKILLLNVAFLASCQKYYNQELDYNRIANDSDYIHYRQTIDKIQLQLSNKSIDINSIVKGLRNKVNFNPCEYDENDFLNVKGHNVYFALQCDLFKTMDAIEASYGKIMNNEEVMIKIYRIYKENNSGQIENFKKSILNNKK